MKMKKQQQPKKYCFKNTEHLSIQVADFMNICSLTYALQSYLVVSVSICQNLAGLMFVKVKT